MELEIKPYGKRLMVEQLRKDAKTKGGILMPEQARQSLPCGEVLLVGKYVPKDIPVGSFVFFQPFAGSDVEWEGHTVKFIEPEDILGVAERPEDTDVVSGSIERTECSDGSDGETAEEVLVEEDGGLDEIIEEAGRLIEGAEQ